MWRSDFLFVSLYHIMDNNASNTSSGTDIIKLLPESVANQIAAGEVIERPASVIKELVENSVDAGADSIEIVIKDAGRTLIQVVDNGKGMSVTDARMAFERHATSKIRKADDLFTLHTMGFRGEALPSIAAVSELEMTTMRGGDELGTKIVIKASKVESQEPVASVKGTNIMVKNLFYNFVARRRFLKKDSVELSHIVQEFERLALVNPGIALKLTHNGSVLHQLQRSSLRARIGALFGKNLEKNLIPVETETSLAVIKGFISLPSAAKTRGAKQYFFVNGRNMRHPYFHKAVVSCFENLIAKDAQPQYFLNFDVPPEKIDVNIHPKKHEIKFEEEQSIWQILTASIRNSLGRYNVGTTIDFDNIGEPDIPPLVEGGPLVDSPVDTTGDTDYTPFATPDFDMRVWDERPEEHRLDFSQAVSRPSSLNGPSPKRRDSGRQINIPSNWDALYAAFTDEKNREQNQTKDETRRSFWQLRNRYILTETSGGLLIIDQHRAHVTILYHSMMEANQGGNLASQNLLFEMPLDLEQSQKIILDSSIDIIERLGFRIHTSDDQYLLTAVPSVLDRSDPVDMLRKIIGDLAETGADIESDVISRLSLTLARGAAIQPGQSLTTTEQEHIVNSLFKLESPRYTPDGHLIIADLDDDALSRFFSKHVTSN